jgi:hypothetical protein
LIIWNPTTSVGCRSARPCRHAAQQQVAGVDLALLLLVVRGRNFRQQHDVCQRFGGFVADERLAAFGDDRLVEADSLFEVCVHGERYLT